ncbi:hypothetical protein [Dyella silvae]|uniref:hypothetical protein n=1 Tax=Dyella silvae TaxID=2994424 RepID=UPI002263BA6B|nr:hypothetical protein [Dyella silvae]
MSQTASEIAKDILVAVVSNPHGSALTNGTADDVKRKVAEAYEAIFDSVKKKHNGG